MDTSEYGKDDEISEKVDTSFLDRIKSKNDSAILVPASSTPYCSQRQQDEQELAFLSSTIDTTIMPTKSEHVNNSDKQTMKNGSTREKSQSTRSTTSSHRLRSKTPTITLQGGNLTNWNWNLKTREINGVLFAWQNKLTKKTNLIIISFTRWLTPEEWLLAWL